MADNRWEPKALAVSQVNTVTIANTWAQNDTVTLTINTKALVITIGTLTTTSQVATTVQEAWEGSTLTDTSASYTPAGGGQDIAEFAEITATVSGAVVSLTHDIPGRPFTLTATETTGGDGTATGATATAADGPNNVNNVNNWSAGTVPATGENLYIDNSDVSLLYNLNDLNDTAASLTIGANFTGDIGLPKTNPAGYTEYLPDYFDMPISAIYIGVGDGQGSGRIKLDNKTVQTAWAVEKTGSSNEAGLPPVILKGTHASNTLDVNSGEVGVSVYGGETGVIATARIGSGTVEFGEGCTVTTLTNQSGNINIRNPVTTLTSSSGTVTCWEAMTIVTASISGGTLDYRSSGTIATLNIGGTAGPVLDCSNDNSSRTITALVLNAGATIIDPLRTITYTSITIGGDVDTITVA